MDFLKLLINSDKVDSICFLCFKCDNNNLDIHLLFEICNEYNNIQISLADMVKSLFPYHDILFGQACTDCTELITKLFITIQKQKAKAIMLNSIVAQLSKRIDEHCCKKINNQVLYLDLQVTRKSCNQTKEDNQNFDATIPKEDQSLFPSQEILKSQQNDNEIMNTCPHCPETLQQANQLHSHLKTHRRNYKRKEKHLYCNECNYKTLSKSTLQAHINKQHLQSRPHICHICFKSFYKKSNLNEHIQTHNRQRNEVCDVCGRSFLHKKNLTEHLRLHSDTRPYQCDICSKRFITSGRRSDHIKRSHMERLESCLICNKRYSLKKELARHMNTVHLRTM